MTKDAAMCAKDAAMCAKDATMSSRDAALVKPREASPKRNRNGFTFTSSAENVTLPSVRPFS